MERIEFRQVRLAQFEYGIFDPYSFKRESKYLSGEAKEVKKMGRLHVLTDICLQTHFSHVELAQLAIVGGADTIQFRQKDGSTREMIRVAERMQALCKKAGVTFIINDRVDVVGISKGRGFAGFHKRHHFGGGGAAHGSMFHRAPGSIGASAFPSRVMKGMRAAGHMGNAQVTTRNLRVVQVLLDDNTILIEGSVPGPQGGYVVVHKAKAPHQ